MLKRPKKISDGMGGFKKLSDETIPPQKMRLVTQTESVTVVSHTADGEEVNVDYVLIGMWDSNISNGDYFIMNGHKYEIVLVREDRSYETWAQVTDRG